ncbi:MAG TPA: DinB family protein [Candidatus Kapabacteria bacterium]|nr:DinB family protein [Candidatus Kapabacteria bacterium]
MKTRSQTFKEQRQIMVDWVNMYLDALTDDELKMEIVPGRNHGVWILGHLIASDDDLSLYINKEPVLYPDCQELFQQGSVLKSVESYPPISELRRRWKAVCEKNEILFDQLRDEMLDEPHEMIKGDPEKDFFKTKDVCLMVWTLHQVHMAGELALLLGKAGRRLV